MKSFALLGLVLLATQSFANNKVVYGVDNRMDVFETSDQYLVDLAASTAAKIKKEKMTETPDGTFEISGITLGAKKRLCKDERFYNQKTAASCSGFLVAPDLLVTAGHCVKSQADCDSTNWVFGFSVSEKGDEVDTIHGSSVYSCVEIIDRKNDKTKNDYALIRLDRQVLDRTPLSVRREGKISSDTKLLLIGHPTGLPTKIAPDAKVRANSNPIFFMANTDSFGGNSGSAVFNQETGVVEGILVRGETDYTYDWNAKCRRPYRCPENLCRGEGVTRITNITPLMEML